MDTNNRPNHFNNPVVIILALALIGLGGYFLFSKNSDQVPQATSQATNVNPQQNEIDTLKNEVEGLKNQKQPTAQAKSSSLSDIVNEWQKSTAYVECYWDTPGTQKWFLKQSGSGLVALFSGTPTIITNEHVVNNQQYGTPNECDIKFPNDNNVFYAILPVQSGYGKMEFDSNGNDVAYLSGLKQNGFGDPSISLQQRARNDNFSCKSNSINTGSQIVVLGYPTYGTDISSVFDKIELTATEGIISGKDDPYYTTSAKIEHGNSGGLAIDKTNDCYVGIPTWNESGSFESLGRILPATVFLK